MMRCAKIVVLGCLLLGSADVVAQTAAGPPRDPKPCEPGALPPQPPTRPSGTVDPGTTGSGENLSDKLARGDGVLCPPEVGRDMRIPPRDGGKTPVIPPPGSPGGDPNVRPK